MFFYKLQCNINNEFLFILLLNKKLIYVKVFINKVFLFDYWFFNTIISLNTITARHKMNNQEESQPIVTESIDLSKSSIEDVKKYLNINESTGLSSTEVQTKLLKYGPNAIIEKEVTFFQKVVKSVANPISYMIEAAALVSAFIGHWDDFTIIMSMLIINVVLELIQDKKASAALSALKKSLAPSATVMRDAKWQTIDTADLVPGDVVKIHLGGIVPADLRLISGEYASIDQAALTGESLPVSKKVGDLAYSGSVVKQGEMVGAVIATGINTFFGKTANLVSNAGAESHAQKAMFDIGNYLIILSVILSFVLIAAHIHHDLATHHMDNASQALGVLQYVLVLLVASIPVAMPTVFAVTMALGALQLSKEQAIVSKLSAIEEMAGVDILCSDKTGTLTKNQLSLSIPLLVSGQDPTECILIAALASNPENRDAIDVAIVGSLHDPNALNDYKQIKVTPFDPVTKYSKAIISDKNGREFVVAKGAPQAISKLANINSELNEKVNDIVATLAKKGSRALGVAKSIDNGVTWDYLGILPMFDPPRDDSKSTIELAALKGVRVKMITGDDTAIAIETAKQLGMGTNILTATDVFPKDMDPNNVPGTIVDAIENADGFARVFPEHKYAIVKALQKRGHLVAMTGDGVNDAPALKQADCGVAVSGATDAARGAAALILTAPGLSVINTAIDEARRIFGRITSYTLYRVAITIDIMFLVVLSIIFNSFIPVTAAMIVVMSLLDDIPMVTIAYDNTAISEKPIKWKMPRLLFVSSVLGILSVIESYWLVPLGMDIINNPAHSSFFDLHNTDQLQTAIFLQLIAGGHLLLFITRTEKWFFQKPYPSWKLFWAIMATQILAVFLCAYGWFMHAISWKLIGWVWAYNIIWMFALAAVRILMERLLEAKNNRHERANEIVNSKLN